jgi:hypothetical protein
MYTVIAVFNSLSVLGRSRYTADFAASHISNCTATFRTHCTCSFDLRTENLFTYPEKNWLSLMTRSAAQNWPNFYNGATALRGSWSPFYGRFTITLRHTTIVRTPLDEWSARLRKIYLTTHSTHKKQTSIFPVTFQQQSHEASGHWDRRIGLYSNTLLVIME